MPSSPDQHKSGFFEHYPLYDDIFLRLNFVILFLVAVSPFLMQGFWISPDFVNPMSILYALDIMGVYAILGVLHQRYVWQNEDQLKVEEEREVKMDRNMQFTTSVWFLISAVIPVPIPPCLLDVVSTYTAHIPPPHRSTPCQMKR